MAQDDLTDRVGILEAKVQGLETLPVKAAAIESQILLLHDEMRDGFSAVLGEIRTVDEGLRGEIKAVDEGLRGENFCIKKIVLYNRIRRECNERQRVDMPEPNK